MRNLILTFWLCLICSSLAQAQDTPFKFGVGLSGLPSTGGNLAVSAESRVRLADFLSFSVVGDLSFGSDSTIPNYYLRLLLTLEPLYFGPTFTYKDGPIYGATAGLNLGLFYLEGQANFPAAAQNLPRFAIRAGLMISTPSLISAVDVLSPGKPNLPGSASSSFKQGQVWNVTSSDGEVYISVWDNQCEDGDQISVSLSGYTYSVELRNQPHTYTVRLTPGNHRLRIIALNGSGFKGKCSYANANTYSIRVWGKGQGTPSTYYTFTTEAQQGYDHTVNLTIP